MWNTSPWILFHIHLYKAKEFREHFFYFFYNVQNSTLSTVQLVLYIIGRIFELWPEYMWDLCTYKDSVTRFTTIYLLKRLYLDPMWTGKNGFENFFVSAKIFNRKVQNLHVSVVNDNADTEI